MPARLLIVTSLYPTEDLPSAGIFVKQRVDALRAADVVTEVVAPPRYTDSVFVRYVRLAVRAFWAARRADAIEAHVLIPTGAIGVGAGVVWRRRVVVVAHGSDVSYTAWRNPAMTRLARWTVRHASAIVANSRATGDLITRLGGVSMVVSPGVDFARFTVGPDERAALGLPQGFLALFVGPPEEHKGIDIFVGGIEAAGWTGLVVGHGHPREVGRRVVAIGPQTQAELVRYLRSVDCVVVPSRREGLGLIAIEALACGTPVIATRAGGLPDIVRSGQNGILMAEATPAALASALQAIVARRWDPADLRDSVRTHDLAATTRQMETIWRTVLDGSGESGDHRRGRRTRAGS